VAPFRVFGAAARPTSLPLWVVLLWNRVLVQSPQPGEVHRHCFDGPALPLALASAVRSSCTRVPPTTVRLPAASSRRASPSFRVLPSNTYPTAATVRSSHGLWLPTAHGRIRGPLLASSEPLATFRLQGLATLLTAYSLESRAGFLSHRQRSWDSPFGGLILPGGFRAFRLGYTHVPFGPAVSSAARRRRTGPQGSDFWVLASRKCRPIVRGFKPTTADASLGSSSL
jgi:hypothetical protein